MLKQPLLKKIVCYVALILCSLCLHTVYAANDSDSDDNASIDRIELVTQQINLLKNRQTQGDTELLALQDQHDKEISQLAIEKVNKNLLDKASLDISVSKSNLDSINIELTDCQQTISWLEKSVQEIKNQLNVMTMFGLKFANNANANSKQLYTDLAYQQKLLGLEKQRLTFLQNLQSTAANILTFKKENFSRIDTLLKSRNLLHVKQQQVRDELEYQQEQNEWLSTLDGLYARLSKIDPLKARDAYAQTERDIFYANENASLAYSKSLVARYKDQIDQMKLAVLRSSSISLLNEVGDQMQMLGKQIARLDSVLNSRMAVMDRHISYLSQKKPIDAALHNYIAKLTQLKKDYQATDAQLIAIDKSIVNFRSTLDHAIQNELASRQGFPTFGFKTIVDLGKEMLLVPELAFQIVKSLAANLSQSFQSTTWFGWISFIFMQSLAFFTFFFLRNLLQRLLDKPSAWREKINSKWLSLQWLRSNFLDLFIIAEIIAIMNFFAVPAENYTFIISTALVWLAFKAIIVVARLCLVETTHNSSGNDMRLFQRLKWFVLAGAIITAMTVFIHQLPLIYELKALFDRLFLLLLMVLSLLLLRSWDVVPTLILSSMEDRHPYFQKSVRLVGILVPILMFANSLIGLFGFVNLIMTVSWYEGIFMIVLIGYLILRGLLSDGLEQISRLMIQYVNNGWLLSEAFLKPLDKVLRITLFFAAWVVLFLLYGWDNQSPIVARLNGMLHYQLLHVLGTAITPLSMIELLVVISIFYWTAKWTREFVYRMLASRTKDMGIRNSIAILSQYSVVVLGIFFCLRVLGIDLKALAFVTGMFAFGIGLGLRDLANNFACGFLILLERPLRVGDIVNINGIEGEVTNIGSRAVIVRTWDHMDHVVPNTEIFNKSFINWTARDNTVRTVVPIKIGRHDNPHEVKAIIQNVLTTHKDVLRDPIPEVFLKEMSDTLMSFEVRYFVNIRQVKSRTSVLSVVLMAIWDAFAVHGIKPPYPQAEVFLRNEMPAITFQPLS